MSRNPNTPRRRRRRYFQSDRNKWLTITWLVIIVGVVMILAGGYFNVL